ncbi:methyl-accepting chemotaxis protein [Oryzibacter oryziterrae]|uniref:methyl-accepting chemotaxis protein n=1 Tax=Oryzibacter oryziterrae TaxID=2766474 RepID=UPI001F01EADE|nr:methyl-accepting chemotaxis protein [Oryzibacter oryziterrae]
MKLTIKTSLLTLLCALAAMVLLQGLVALKMTGDINANVGAMATKWLPSVEQANTLNTMIATFRAAEGSHIIAASAADQAKAEGIMTKVNNQIKDALAKYRPLVTSPDEIKQLDLFETTWAQYTDAHKQLLDLSRKKLRDASSKLFSVDMRPLFDTATKTLLDTIALNDQGAAAAYRDSMALYQRVTMAGVGAIVVGLLLAVGGIVFAFLRIVRPLSRLTNAIQDISAGNYDLSVYGAARHDEVGVMARAVDGFRASLAQAEVDRAAQVERDAEIARRAREERVRTAEDLNSRVGALVEAFLRSSEEVSGAATHLSSTADETSKQAQAVAYAAETASENVQTVAASAEELAASVREINGQVVHSAKVADTAFQEAESTNSRIAILANAASAIGDVVNLIKGIADQTNLLALNATIEAARAGEMGKGFAVVAQEVKQLASQTAKATDEISHKIGEMQQATDVAVGSITEIVRTISNVKEIASAIAGAVEEQGAATSEIAANTQRAAEGTAVVTGNIAGVGAAAEMTGTASGQLMGLARNLSQQAQDLKETVEGFVQDLRAA